MTREECQAFGQELVRLRKERGVGLDEITRDTKIRRQVIEAFEAGRFEELPPEVFAVGFLRAYAEKLGTPADPLVSRYRKILRPAPELPPASRRARGGRGRAPKVAALWAIAFFLASAIAAFWLMGWWPFEGMGPIPPEEPRSASAEGSVVPIPTPPSEPARDASSGETHSSALSSGPEAAGIGGGEAAPAPEAEGVPPLGEPNANPEPPAPPQAARGPASEPPVGGDLVLVFSEPCWIELRGDGQRLLRREVAPGERLAFQGSDFKADIGNAAGLQVFYRGRAVPLPGGRGQVLKDVRLSIPQGPP